MIILCFFGYFRILNDGLFLNSFEAVVFISPHGGATIDLKEGNANWMRRR